MRDAISRRRSGGECCEGKGGEGSEESEGRHCGGYVKNGKVRYKNLRREEREMEENEEFVVPSAFHSTIFYTLEAKGCGPSAIAEPRTREERRKQTCVRDDRPTLKKPTRFRR